MALDISKFGVDIGYLQGGVMVWTVIAPTANRVFPGCVSGPDLRLHRLVRI